MADAVRPRVPSLDATFSSQAVTMALTEAGLVTDRSTEIVRRYAEQLSWEDVKAQWHDERLAGRGSRHSAQKVFRVIKGRLLAGGEALPDLPTLATLLGQCPTEEGRAQLFYLYLIEADPLVRYVVHAILRRQGLRRERWDLSPATLRAYLSDFSYDDGTTLSYAESTLERWVRGLRSVFRDIGVLRGPYDEEGVSPLLDAVPLHVSAAYSWSKSGSSWQERPLGWIYLFQPQAHWDVLARRLAKTDHWELFQRRTQASLEPADRAHPFG